MLNHLQGSPEWSSKNVAEKGVTLIELLVVLVILGILAAVAILAMRGDKNAKDNACETEVAAVEAAYTRYLADHNGDRPTGATDSAVLATLRSATGSGLAKDPVYVKGINSDGTITTVPVDCKQA